eukprot:6189610-Pleurochrysis_carterae.AAC.1
MYNNDEFKALQCWRSAQSTLAQVEVQRVAAEAAALASGNLATIFKLVGRLNGVIWEAQEILANCTSTHWGTKLWAVPDAHGAYCHSPATAHLAGMFCILNMSTVSCQTYNPKTNLYKRRMLVVNPYYPDGCNGFTPTCHLCSPL